MPTPLQDCPDYRVEGKAAVSEPTFWSSLEMNTIIQKGPHGKRKYVHIKVHSRLDICLTN